MKKTLLLLCFLSVLISCKKREELLTFDVREQTEFYVDPVVSLDLPISIVNIPVQVTAKDAIEQKGMKLEHVENIRLSEAKLVMVDPANHTFNFIKALEVAIHGENLPEKLLAFHNDVPLNVHQFDMVTTGEKMDDYLKKDNFMINVEATTREVLTKRVLIRAEMVFKVTGKIFK